MHAKLIIYSLTVVITLISPLNSFADTGQIELGMDITRSRFSVQERTSVKHSTSAIIQEENSIPGAMFEHYDYPLSGRKFSQDWGYLEYVTTAASQEHYKSVNVNGNYAYCVDGWPFSYSPPYSHNYNGLVIYDISVPDNSVRLAYLDLPGNGYDLEVHGNYSYISNSSQGVQIVDVSQPQSPVLLSNYSPGSGCYNLTVIDSIAYIGSEYGLEIINVADPINPFGISRLNLQRTWDVTIKDSLAYCTTILASGDLSIVNISDPANPFLIGMSANIPGSPQRTAISNNVVYMISGKDGSLNNGLFASIDVSNTANPVLMDTIATLGQFPHDVKLGGDYAYVADAWDGRFLVIDIQDPNNLLLQGTCVLDNPYGLVLRDSIAYVADYWSCLSVIDISEPSSPTVIANTDRCDYTRGVAIKDSLLFAAEKENGLLIYKVAEPNNPIFLGKCDTPGSAEDVVVNNGYAYIADGFWTEGGVAIVDISDPTMPTFITKLIVYGRNNYIAIVDTFVLLAGGNAGMHIVNVANPASPYLVSTLADEINSVAASGQYAYGGYGYKMRIIDISNPINPTQTSEINIGNSYPMDIEIQGNFAYVASFYDGLAIVDISDPYNPFVRGKTTNYPWSNAWGVGVYGNAACVVDFIGGIALIDASDPGNPEVIDYTTTMTFNGSSHAVMDSMHIYMANFYDLPIFSYSLTTGIDEIVTHSTPEMMLFQNSPNPFTSVTLIRYYLPRRGIVNLGVYDVTGRLIKTIVHKKQKHGWYKIAWNGRNDSGKELPSGIYYIRLSQGTHVEMKKVLVVK